MRETTTLTAADAAAVVREFEDAYTAAFNNRDARALAALFLEDATVVTEWGDVVPDRAAFERGLARVFAVVPGELRLENTPTHAKAVADDVIVSHGTARRFDAAGSRGDPIVYTRVLVRRDGAWRLAANHVSEPTARPHPLANDR